jgi:hypothetical protein
MDVVHSRREIVSKFRFVLFFCASASVGALGGGCALDSSDDGGDQEEESQAESDDASEDEEGPAVKCQTGRTCRK